MASLRRRRTGARCQPLPVSVLHSIFDSFTINLTKPKALEPTIESPWSDFCFSMALGVWHLASRFPFMIPLRTLDLDRES
jgi:hypothetical protein